jgi:hypothetical protein
MWESEKLEKKTIEMREREKKSEKNVWCDGGGGGERERERERERK